MCKTISPSINTKGTSAPAAILLQEKEKKKKKEKKRKEIRNSFCSLLENRKRANSRIDKVEEGVETNHKQPQKTEKQPHRFFFTMQNTYKIHLYVNPHIFLLCEAHTKKPFAFLVKQHFFLLCKAHTKEEKNKKKVFPVVHTPKSLRVSPLFDLTPLPPPPSLLSPSCLL